MKITEFMFDSGRTIEELKDSPGINGIISDILDYAKNRLVGSMENPESNVRYIHPTVIITLLVTNLAVNLASAAITTQDAMARLEMMKDLSSGIKKMIDEAWQVMETAEATGEKH
tara:strand:+ start:6513 stop:6857 length:345 start_codon:yes stop_codon:yes gene_type:complete